MRFLIDMPITPLAVGRLEAAGHDAIHASNTGLALASDSDILEAACTYTPGCTGLTGKANFGFNSKYKNGATVPTGNTNFHFNAGNFKFDSDVYEWLVISGPKAKYKGTGKVNGTAGFGFELTAWDGQVGGRGGTDKFRIKIWQDNPGNVVYDNERGIGDAVDPSTALGGGSVVIHKN